MAIETLIGDIDENTRYWKPEQLNEQIEGNLINFEEDNWGKDRMVLELEDGSEKVLPGHSDLIRYNSKVEIGDYLIITLDKINKSTNPDYADKNVYKVQKDVDKYVEYETEEDGDEL